MALWWANGQGWEIEPLTFSYFGRPRNEDVAIDALVRRVHARPPRRVDLPFLKEIDDLRRDGLENQALLDSPEGYIPARNLIFYSLAAYFAEVQGTRYLVGGHNGTDPEAFPDASPRFFENLNRVFGMSLWTAGRTPVETLVPLSGMSKADVVRMGLSLGVPFEVTWSCYWDRDRHCGTCASCRERRDAFVAAGAEDPVTYDA